MTNKALISIITPSFNQGQFLEETILSVVNQTYKNIEYIIIDGGSTDDSVNIIKKYKDKIKYWISEKDKGQADAINKGFEKSTGDYLCWVNSDDLLYPDFIERRMEEFRKHENIDLIYGDVEQGWETSKKILRKGAQQNYNEMLHTCIIKIPQMSAIWKRKIYENVKGLNTNLKVLLDWEYFLRISEKHKILYIPGSVAFFRQHQSSKSIKYNSLWAEETEKYYLDFFLKNKYPKRLESTVLINMYFYCAGIFEEDNNFTEAQNHLEKAKKINPSSYFIKKTKKRTLLTLMRIKKKLRHENK